MRVARSAAMLVAVLAAALGLASTASAASAPCAGSGYLASAAGIQRFSTATNAVTATISAPAIVDLAVSPDGAKVYAVDQTGNQVRVIDTATDTQTATINVGAAPKAVAVAPDSATVYVGNSGTNSLSVITVATGAVATVAVGAEARDVVVSLDGTKVYVAAADGVRVYSGGSMGAPLAGIATATKLALSADGKTLFVADGTSVTPVTTATDTAGTPVTLAAQALAAGPTGTPLYYAGTATAGTDSLVARSADASTSIGSATNAGGVLDVAVKPDGSAIYAASATRLDVLGPTGTALASIAGTALTAVAACPAVAPDAPTALKGTPGDKTVDLTWTAPADTGGAAITSYTATAQPGGATCTTTGATTCTVTGLRNATAYTFTVAARTIAGSSPASKSVRVTPRRDNGARKLTIGTPVAKITRKGVAVTLDITATGPGVVALVGKYKAARACAVSKRVGAAGVYRVRCVMAASARALARRRAVTYTLLATFSPTNGPLASARTSIVVPRRR